MFDIITTWMSGLGHVGVAALMLAENVFPPIPSELVMPLAGYLSAEGQLWLPAAIFAGTIGSVLGALFWYYIGIWIGEERLQRFAARHGAWLTLSPKDVDSAGTWFRDYGWRAVFFGRMIPGVRTLISVPAGMARMPLRPFLIFTTLGSLIWTGLLAAEHLAAFELACSLLAACCFAALSCLRLLLAANRDRGSLTVISFRAELES